MLCSFDEWGPSHIYMQGELQNRLPTHGKRLCHVSLTVSACRSQGWWMELQEEGLLEAPSFHTPDLVDLVPDQEFKTLAHRWSSPFYIHLFVNNLLSTCLYQSFARCYKGRNKMQSLTWFLPMKASIIGNVHCRRHFTCTISLSLHISME